jgi:CBS domain-containing protein
VGQKIRDVMTANPITVDVRTPVPEAARVMRDHDVGDVLVIDDDMLRGIVTDRDVAVRAVADHGDVSNLPVGDICSTNPVTVEADDDVDRAIDLMRKEALRRLPVVDHGNVVGIVTLGDIAMEHAPQSALSDISEAPPNR